MHGRVAHRDSVASAMCCADSFGTAPGLLRASSGRCPSWCTRGDAASAAQQQDCACPTFSGQSPGAHKRQSGARRRRRVGAGARAFGARPLANRPTGTRCGACTSRPRRRSRPRPSCHNPHRHETARVGGGNRPAPTSAGRGGATRTLRFLPTETSQPSGGLATNSRSCASARARARARARRAGSRTREERGVSRVCGSDLLDDALRRPFAGAPPGGP